MIVVAVMIVIEVVDVLKGKVQGSSSSSSNARNYCDGGSDRGSSACGGSFDSYL